MRIALLNRHEGGRIGGDMIHLRGHQAGLIKLGYEVDYIYNPKADLCGYDEVWIYHLNFRWAHAHWRNCIKYNKPYRVVSIFYPELKGVGWQAMRRVVEGAICVYCASNAEKLDIVELLNPDCKIRVVPCGLDKMIFTHKGPKVDTEPFVLSVARFEEYKGHHRVLEACKELNLPVVAIGPYSSMQYVNRCKKINPDALIIGELSQEELTAYYRRAKVFVCASTNDRFNMCITEAVQCGARVITSKQNRGNEWFVNAPIVDPDNQTELQSAISKEWALYPELQGIKVWSWNEVVDSML